MKAADSVVSVLARRRGSVESSAGPLQDKGTGAPALRLFALSAVLTAAFFALTAAPALAARGHEFDPGLSLGKPCTEVVCAPGELKEPSAVAVNEATNQVYVLDQGNNRVEIFNGETGAVAGGFNGSATPAGSFEFPAAAQNGALAVDNSCALHTPVLTGAECEAFDPSAGDVYVVDAEHGVVYKFTAAGTYTGQQISDPEPNVGSFRPLFGVAVDSTGDLWISRSNSVERYSNGNPNQFVERGSEFITGPLIPGFAVESTHDFYIRHIKVGFPGQARVGKVTTSGEVITQELDGEQSNAVSVDPRTGTAFLDNLTTLAAFSPAGTELERLGREGGAEHLSEGAGIGVNATTQFLYVADHAADRVVVFGPQLPGPPSIQVGSEFASAITSDSATLHAELNPRSEPGEGATTYFFEYGPCATPTSCSISPYTSRSSEGSLAASFEPQAVSIQVGGLAPATTYHYRVVAENAHSSEPTTGEEAAFATQTVAPFALPDGRRWEMVSPAAKLGAAIEPITDKMVVEASADGTALTYQASSPTEGNPFGYTNLEQILSDRSITGWATRDIGIPHATATGFAVTQGPEYRFFNPQLTLAAVQPYGEFDPALSPEASESTAYLHDLGATCGSACFRPLVSGAPGFENVPPGIEFGEEGACSPAPGRSAAPVCGPEFLDATDDLSHVVLRSGAELTPGAGAQQLYEWSAGTLSHLSVLPGPAGESAPPGEARIGLENQGTRGAISADGSRIDWSTREALYQRDTSTGETVQLDRVEAGCGGCESGGGRFQFASADGSRVFFTDNNKLTEGSGANRAGAGKADLYECKVEVDGTGELACALTDLTPKNGTEAAEVQGSILGASADGSYLYFVANGALTGAPNARGERAAPGTCEGLIGSQSFTETCNLYLDHDGTVSFVASLSAEDLKDWSELGRQPTRVSRNGLWLEFLSSHSPTGYDSRDAASGRPVAEAYLYSAVANRLICASCDPTGARPDGREYHLLEPGSGGLVGNPGNAWVSHGLVAATVPGWTTLNLEAGATKESRYQDRYLSNSGRLFFNAADALVPQDSNGNFDVYEYEPTGVGGCSESSSTFGARSGGCVDLISAGTSGQESAFMDASESGDDVFFLTYSRLNPTDTDNQLDIYDAHVCSAASPCLPEAAPSPEPCSGEACQQALQPPIESSPSSQSFSGPGNPRHHHKKHRRKHHRKKHHHKHQSKHRHHNSGGGGK